MSAEDEAFGEQLREKIAGKFQITSILAGFCFTTISIDLTFLFQANITPPLLPQSIATMFASLVLYCWGLYRLGALTMPQRFSFEGQRANVPAGAQTLELTPDDLWALKHRMVLYWLMFTVVALFLTAA